MANTYLAYAVSNITGEVLLVDEVKKKSAWYHLVKCDF